MDLEVIPLILLTCGRWNSPRDKVEDESILFTSKLMMPAAIAISNACMGQKFQSQDMHFSRKEECYRLHWYLGNGSVHHSISYAAAAFFPSI